MDMINVFRTIHNHIVFIYYEYNPPFCPRLIFGDMYIPIFGMPPARSVMDIAGFKKINNH